jgi:hypothetical protein
LFGTAARANLRGSLQLTAHQSLRVQQATAEIRIARFTPLDEIERAISRELRGINLPALAERTIQDAFDRFMGRV